MRWTVEDALVTGRPFRYVAYRLRFFALGQLLAIAIHVVELLFLRRLFTLPSLVPIFVTQSLCHIGMAGWWGFLETMRDQVRGSMRDNDRAGAARIASRYLSLSLLVAGLIVVAALLAVSPRPILEGDAEAAVEVYKALAGLRLAAFVVARTYHSAAFSIRRVHRPFWASVFTDLAGLALLPLLYPLVGGWALPLRLVVLSAMSLGLNVHFVRRTLADLRFFDVRISLTAALNDPLPGVPLRTAVGAAIAWGATQAGSALTLVVSRGSGDHADASRTVFFYLLGPVLTASAMWGNIFYFDLTKVREGAYDRIREVLIEQLRAVALGWGVCMGLVGALAAHLVLRTHISNTPWFLPVLAALLALSSVEQVRLFVARQYGSIVLGILVLGVGMALMLPAKAAFSSYGAAARSVAELATLCVSLVVASQYFRGRVVTGERPNFPTLLAWQARLGAASKVHAGYIRFRGAGRAPTLRFSKSVMALFPDFVWTLSDKRTLLWFSTLDKVAPDLGRQIMAASAGLVHRVETLASGIAGQAASAQLGAWLQCEPLAKATTEDPYARIAKRFQAAFPNGIVVDFSTPPSGRTQCASESLERVQILRAGIAETRARATAPKAQRNVIAYAPHGALRALFVLPPGTDGRERQAWRERIHSAAARAM